MSNPFRSSASKAGHGHIHLALLPPNTPRLQTASYQYPLKLISPAPVRNSTGDASLVHTVYLLTYGGGIVAGDEIHLDVTLEQSTRLILLTQGSTKLFKSPSRDVLSKQCMSVTLDPGAALCYLPDPVQPFERSSFEQRQIYNIAVPSGGQVHGSLCVLDWVSNGRPANGENWSFFRYGSKNEVHLKLPDGSRRLLLRDNMALVSEVSLGGSMVTKMSELGLYATLVICGPLFERLGRYFMDEFKTSAQIGGRKWDSGSESGEEDVPESEVKRTMRQRLEAVEGVLWSAASVRGCVVVKLGVKSVEAGRRWLYTVLSDEGTVDREFGGRALLCLRN